MILEVDATLGVVTPEVDATFSSSLKGNLQVEAHGEKSGQEQGGEKPVSHYFGCFYCVVIQGRASEVPTACLLLNWCVCTCGCPELTNQARQMAGEVPFHLSLRNKAVNKPGEQIAGEWSGSDVLLEYIPTAMSTHFSSCRNGDKSISAQLYQLWEGSY